MMASDVKFKTYKKPLLASLIVFFIKIDTSQYIKRVKKKWAKYRDYQNLKKWKRNISIKSGNTKERR